MPSTKPKTLIGMSLPELEELMISLGLEKFRAKQLFKWIYSKSERDLNKMTDLSPKVREALKATPLGSLNIEKHQISKDGTQKFLFKTSHGDSIESVFMPMGDSAASEDEAEPDFTQDLRRSSSDEDHKQENSRKLDENYKQANKTSSNTDTHYDPAKTVTLPKTRVTACISSQVGCAVRCPFCTTGTLGFKRNLEASEIIEQVLLMQHITGTRIDNLVFMGQGEPLNNYDNVVSAIKMFRYLVGIGVRHITVSTSGVVPAMLRLAEEGMQVTLALSLHDADDNDRDYLVPINTKWKIAEVLAALKNFVTKTNRRVTIEYAMMKDINDSVEKAELLGKKVKDIHCNINLIPYNSTDVKDKFQRSEDRTIREFAIALEDSSHGKTVTIRKERGHDIDAACGQLANK